MNTPALSELLYKLSKISTAGPIKAVGLGDKSVGITLLEQLGLRESSIAKAAYKGIAISARRGKQVTTAANRVNLFAKVPDWDISACQSSKEILVRHGYVDGDSRRLYCSVNSRRPNSLGLMFKPRPSVGLIEEICVRDGIEESVATWRLAELERRLTQSQPESLWITAALEERVDGDYFHYRFATYMGKPRVNILGALLDQGVVTMDHLISDNGGHRVVEKGPLFKISPANLSALFQGQATYDLMSL